MAKVKTEVRKLLVTYEAANGGTPTNGIARDAALGGLFIETTSPLAVGALLTVELKSPDSSISLDARVFLARAKANGDHPAGMAVRFLDLPAGALGKLQSILEHHRPPARTQLGVGSERGILVAPPVPPPREPEAPAPQPEPADMASNPPSPRHPTPRMVPVASSSSQTPSSVTAWSPQRTPGPESSGQLPWSVPSPEAYGMPPRRVRKALVAAIAVGTIILLVAVAVLLAR